MDGSWDAWAPNAFLEQSGPADQPTYPDGLLLPNSSHAGAGVAVEDLLRLGLPVGGHRLQQGDALQERPGPLQGLADLVRHTRPPESPSRWVYTPEPGKWACPYRGDEAVGAYSSNTGEPRGAAASTPCLQARPPPPGHAREEDWPGGLVGHRARVPTRGSELNRRRPGGTPLVLRSLSGLRPSPTRRCVARAEGHR